MAPQPPAEDADADTKTKTKSKGKTDGPVVTPLELEPTLTYESKLGEGTYGIVYMAKMKSDGTFVAVKEIKIDHCDDGIPSTAIRELAVLKEVVGNDYIVNLIDIVHGEQLNRLFLVFEYFN